MLGAFNNRLFLQKFENCPENLMKFVSFENTFILTAILSSLKHAKLNAAVSWYTPRFLTYHFLLCTMHYMRWRLNLSRKIGCDFFCLILFLQNAKTVSSPNSKNFFLYKVIRRSLESIQSQVGFFRRKKKLQTVHNEFVSREHM